MSIKISTSRSDPFLLQCCLSDKRQPYIGVDQLCDKNAKFCIEHSCHINNEGLMHQMMPLRQFKRKIDERKFNMQSKVNNLIEIFSHFIDSLIQQIRQVKLKKCLQLSMLWLRDIAASQDQYQLMKKIYRMDFQDISCRQVHSIYYKIIHNQALYSKQLNQINCYQGICKALSQFQNNKKLVQLLSQKLTQIQGVITNGQLLKKVLPDRKILNQHLKQVLLQQPSSIQNYQINYNKAHLLSSSSAFKPFFSKYALIPHITYHLSIKTKYSNIMLGVCSQKLKQNKFTKDNINDLHYNENSIVYNLANGNTYKQGMFISGSNAAIKGLNQLQIKLRVTNKQIFLMTNKCVLMRSSIQAIKDDLYLMFLSRTEGDNIQVNCDNDISADNVKVLNLIKEQQENDRQIKTQQKIRQKERKQNKIQLAVDQNIHSEQSSSQIIQNRILDTIEDGGRISPHLMASIQNKPISYNQSFARSKQIIPQNGFTGQIIEQQSNLESTIGLYRNKQLQQSQSHKINNHKRQGSNSFFNKIKTNIQNIKKQYKQEQNKVNQKAQEKNQQEWIVDKDKYLKQMRQKISKITNKDTNEKKANKQSLLVPSQSSKATPYKKQPMILNSNYKIGLKSQSGKQKLKSKEQTNSQNSKIQINISDQGLSNPTASLIKMSHISGLRRGSDTINQEDLKLKGLLQMAQSLQPRSTYNKQEIVYNVQKIKTPPKMKQIETRFAINQSFQI